MSENIAYVGLGSNLDQPLVQIQTAIEQLSAHPDMTLLQQSSLYRSQPVGPQDQPDYINAVAKLSTELKALALLDELQTIENLHGRKRVVHWGARTLDLDLLLYNQQIIEHPRLSVPHPELINRSFVLLPLAEIASELSVPGHGPLTALLAKVEHNTVTRLNSDDQQLP